VRHLWSSDALRKADEHLARITEEARDDVDQACRRVIARFESVP
jgi:hypothetical protein